MTGFEKRGIGMLRYALPEYKITKKGKKYIIKHDNQTMIIGIDFEYIFDLIDKDSYNGKETTLWYFEVLAKMIINSFHRHGKE
jgi:hypothetical protein